MVIISAERMAKMYGDRLHRKAFAEIKEKISDFKDSPQSIAYWKIVFAILCDRFPRREALNG